MGYVYLFLEVDNNGAETYKIGVTKNEPIKRIKQLQTGNPRKIELLKTYASENYLKIEKWLHRKYSIKTEAENEWRSLTNEDVFSFIENCKEADNTINFLIENNPFYK